MKDTTFKIDSDKKDRWIIQTERREKRIFPETSEDNSDEFWSRIPGTGGGLNSTAYDLTIFGNCILNKGTLNGVRILGRKAVEKMTTMAIHNIPDYCWGANTPSRGYGVGFDMRQGSAFTFSKGTYNHEGSGASALYIDPVEELVAAWFVPWVNPDEWHAEALWNVINIIWSGIK